MSYRERTDLPSEFSWWRGLCEKHARLFLILFFGTVGFAIGSITTQAVLLLNLSNRRAQLELEKFELEHPRACADAVRLIGVSDPDPCPPGTRFDPYPGVSNLFICKCNKEK